MPTIKFEDVIISSYATSGGGGGGKPSFADLTITKMTDLNVSLEGASPGVALRLYQQVLKDAPLDDLVHVNDKGVPVPIDEFDFEIESPGEGNAVTIDWVALTAGIVVAEGSQLVEPDTRGMSFWTDTLDEVDGILAEFVAADIIA